MHQNVGKCTYVTDISARFATDTTFGIYGMPGM